MVEERLEMLSLVPRWLGRGALLALLAGVTRSDERFYRDTNAMDVADANLLVTPPVVTCKVKTSNAYLAATSDLIMATFIGDFAVSGPHLLGNFPKPGSTKTVSVMLDWTIGELQQIQLQKSGGDQWLLAHMQCQLGNALYELDGPPQWLDQGGIEPNVQPFPVDLPAADTLTISVVDKIRVYTTQGLT